MRTLKKSRLKRKKPSLNPKASIVILCEGRNTEPAYLTALKRHYRRARIVLEIIPAVGVPMTITQEAIKRKKSQIKAAKKSKLGHNDIVCAVFDRDEHPSFEEAKSMCRSNGVLVASSDPCFELWIVLHYENYDKSCNRHEIQRHLEEHDPDYKRNGKKLNFESLVHLIDQAEERAERQIELRFEENNEEGNPSTLMHNLTKAIRKTAETFTT